MCIVIEHFVILPFAQKVGHLTCIFLIPIFQVTKISLRSADLVLFVKVNVGQKKEEEKKSNFVQNKIKFKKNEQKKL